MKHPLHRGAANDPRLTPVTDRPADHGGIPNTKGDNDDTPFQAYLRDPFQQSGPTAGEIFREAAKAARNCQDAEKETPFNRFPENLLEAADTLDKLQAGPGKPLTFADDCALKFIVRIALRLEAPNGIVTERGKPHDAQPWGRVLETGKRERGVMFSPAWLETSEAQDLRTLMKSLGPKLCENTPELKGLLGTAPSASR